MNMGMKKIRSWSQGIFTFREISIRFWQICRFMANDKCAKFLVSVVLFRYWIKIMKKSVFTLLFAFLAIGNIGAEKLLADSSEDRLIRRFEGHKDRVASVGFGSSDDVFVSAGFDGRAILWKIQGNDVKSTAVNTAERAYGAAVGSDGHSAVVAIESLSVVFWDAGSNAEVKMLNAHSAPLLCVAFRKQGDGWASGGKDNNIYLWNGDGNDPVGKLQGHRDAVMSIAFSKDGSRLVSASNDQLGAIWDTKTGKSIQLLKGHKAPVRCAVFNEDATKVATGGYDGAAMLWDAKTGKLIKTFKTPHEKVMGVAFPKGGNRLITAGVDKTIMIWDCKTGKQLESLTGHNGGITSLSISPSGTKLLSSGNNEIVLWDVSEKSSEN